MKHPFHVKCEVWNTLSDLNAGFAKARKQTEVAERAAMGAVRGKGFGFAGDRESGDRQGKQNH